MGQKRTAGLIKRGGVWHIDKQIRGSRLCESTGESDLKQAETYLAKCTEEMRQAVVYGIRPKRTFRLAATKYLTENQDKRRIADTALHLKQLDPFIGSLALDGVHMGTLRPEMNTSVFIIPSQRVKNGDERLVVLNRVAKSVIESVRDEHAEYVFTLRGRPLTMMGNSAWYSARVRVGLPQVRVHDLKHTFGRRLRAAGVSFEDRQDLLGHKSGRITTHYSAAELENLIEAANKVCAVQSRKSPALVLLKQKRRRRSP